MRIDRLLNRMKNFFGKFKDKIILVWNKIKPAFVKKNLKFFISGICGAVILVCAVYFCVRRGQVIDAFSQIESYSEEELFILENALREKKFERSKTVHKLPYETIPAELNINAESAILINADTGDILYEKNADEFIPPASMTKVFLMYTVFQKIHEGKASLDDVVPLPEETWASHMPPHSSLMFLGKGQIVTLRELLQGLAVCSGNDASHAIALYLFGSEEKFIETVNDEIKKCGLEKTKIVEPSGYSEENLTTAREMAAFARIYITKFPESLKDFHSLKKFVYPKPENIAKEDAGKPVQDLSKGHPDSIWSGLEQENTNKLLKTLEGCDGLKTGYIDESGYNLSLTAVRNGERYISVTMKGPGGRYADGEKLRQKDGRTLMEFAFDNFVEIKADEKIDSEYFINEKMTGYENSSDICKKYIRFITPVIGTKNILTGSANTAGLIVPYEINTVVPKFFNGKEVDALNDLKVEIEREIIIFGPVKTGDKFGSIKVFVKDILIEEVPLVCDRTINKKSNFIARGFDRLILKTIEK